jgi:hypothetical protein
MSHHQAKSISRGKALKARKRKRAINLKRALVKVEEKGQMAMVTLIVEGEREK